MPNYQLEIKQKEIFPRCRIGREVLQSVKEDRGIHISGCPGLFLYSVLCSYASPCQMILRKGGISYTIQPGEFLCSVKELTGFLRLHTRNQTIENLWVMQNRGLIQYTMLDRGTLVKFKILAWERSNLLCRADCPNRAENGFFFLPATTVVELVSSVKCSEADILLDLLFSAVHQDDRVKGSYSGPVFYIRSDTSSPLVTSKVLAQRWGLSNRAVGRVLEKLENMGFISIRGYLGGPGAAIYLDNELRTVFEQSDIMLDKADLPLSMNVKLFISANEAPGLGDTMAEKVMQLLAMQGLSCANCRHCTHKLYPLTGKEKAGVGQGPCIGFRMEVLCGWNNPIFNFDLHVYPSK